MLEQCHLPIINHHTAEPGGTIFKPASLSLSPSLLPVFVGEGCFYYLSQEQNKKGLKKRKRVSTARAFRVGQRSLGKNESEALLCVCVCVCACRHAMLYTIHTLEEDDLRVNQPANITRSFCLSVCMSLSRLLALVGAPSLEAMLQLNITITKRDRQLLWTQIVL